MSYEPTIHETQILILRHLLFVPDAGFAQLQKDTRLTSDHFNFHIKKLVDVGYVTKDDGLTAKNMPIEWIPTKMKLRSNPKFQSFC